MMRLDVLIFDSIPVEGNDTFQSEIEAHGGPRSASIRLDPPRVDFHWDSRGVLDLGIMSKTTKSTQHSHFPRGT